MSLQPPGARPCTEQRTARLSLNERSLELLPRGRVPPSGSAHRSRLSDMYGERRMMLVARSGVVDHLPPSDR